MNTRFVRSRRGATLRSLVGLALVGTFGGRAAAQTSLCDMPNMRGTAIYNRYCTGPAPVTAPSQPPPPTQEQLNQQRDAKDLDEAAQDDIDKGDDAYKAGDYAGAVKYFTHALSYEPDSDVAQENLRLAQLHLNQVAAAAAAARQLTAIQEPAPSPDIEAQSNHARTGFDTAGGHGNAMTTSSVHEASADARDPVVPIGRQSAAIRTMERARTRDRQKIAVLKAELKKLDPKTDSVRISTIKQQVSTAKSDVQYQNFSIDAELQKPPTTKSAH